MHLLNLNQVIKTLNDMKNDRRMLEALGDGATGLPTKMSLSVQHRDPKLGGAGHLTVTGTTRDALREILQRQLDSNTNWLRSQGLEWYGDKPEESLK